MPSTAWRSSSSSAGNLGLRGKTALHDPFAHLPDAVELGLPLQPLGRLVALVAAGGGMPLRLREIRDVDQDRDMVRAGGLGCLRGSIWIRAG